MWRLCWLSSALERPWDQGRLDHQYPFQYRDPWVNEGTIYSNAHCAFYMMKELSRREVTLLVFRRGRSWVPWYTSSLIMTWEGACGDETLRVSALGGFASLCKLQSSLSLHIFFLPSLSQRVSTRFRWGNGPVSALKAALKRKCFLKERDSKISGPSYGVWFTKPLLSAKYLLADQVQSPLWD